MEVELIFEERIFEYDEEFLPGGYTSEEFKSERPDSLIINLKNIVPSVDDLFLLENIEKPEGATDKQWAIINDYVYQVESRNIGVNGYIGLNLLIT